MRGTTRAETGALTLGFSGVELATIAFLVVFSLLINAFFWIVMAGSSDLFWIPSTSRSSYCKKRSKPDGREVPTSSI
jgi:hypothetical protein